MDDATTNNFDDLVQTSNLVIVSWISFSFAFVAPLAWTSSFWAWILSLGTHAKPFSFSFSALSFCNFFSCHFGKPIKHISFIYVLDNGKSFLILGTLTFFYSDLAPRISIDNFPTSLPSIAGFFSNVIGFSIVEFRYELFFFRPSYFTRQTYFIAFFFGWAPDWF